MIRAKGLISEAFRRLEKRDLLAAALLLEMLRQRYRHHQEWLNETREKVAIGLAELERGEDIDSETFVNQLLTKFKQAKQAQK